MIQLSKRLKTVANYIVNGHSVADIGSDHALLPVYLLQQGIAPHAIAGEINEGPWKAAQKQIASAGLEQKIIARRGNGLEVIAPNEVDAVTICGMGGALMSTILEEGNQQGKLAGVKQLVLQPNVGEDAVRLWLIEHDWYLQDEQIIEEDGKIYEILHAVRRDDAKQANQELYDGNALQLPFPEPFVRAILVRMGPYLLAKGNEVLNKKWSLELNKYEMIKQSLLQSDLDSAKFKLASVTQDQKLIAEVLTWRFTDKR